MRSLLLMAQFSCLSERMMRSASASGISMTVFKACRALSAQQLRFCGHVVLHGVAQYCAEVMRLAC